MPKAIPFCLMQPMTRLTPGVLLCCCVTAGAFAFQTLEVRLLGRAWLEALVLAIVLGTAIRSVWSPPCRFGPGIVFSGRILLEVAVVLLGSTVSARAILGVGPALLAGIVFIVMAAIAMSYGIGRLFGLSPRMATLIACGNAICGNSAIAAVAPVIGAEAGDVAASIAFTAALGVAVVLGLPLLAATLHMTVHGFGIFAGLTVYAVPQVLAATAPVSSVSAQIGTLVKLVRVLMLGPVVMTLSLLMQRGQNGKESGARTSGLRAGTLMPWFIAGFLLLLAIRSAGLVPEMVLRPTTSVAGWLTVVSMAALGLGVDVRALGHAGPRVTATVMLSLLALGLVSFVLVVALRP
jgi:uncharacterized integral membrane protein (TIGR00698 family)